MWLEHPIPFQLPNPQPPPSHRVGCCSFLLGLHFPHHAPQGQATCRGIRSLWTFLG